MKAFILKYWSVAVHTLCSCALCYILLGDKNLFVTMLCLFHAWCAGAVLAGAFWQGLVQTWMDISKKWENMYMDARKHHEKTFDAQQAFIASMEKQVRDALDLDVH
jgi:hypothetical protein